MSNELPENYKKYVSNITQSGLSIYDPIETGESTLWIPMHDLEKLLNEGLMGMSLHGLRLRTRSKIVKQAICRILGYPVPTSFKRTHPRFPGQRFDTYIQKANNLQIWNEEISHTRRYVIINVSRNDLIHKVKVVTGDILASLDTTGTLTQKHQARFIKGEQKSQMLSEDTENLALLLQKEKYSTSFVNTASNLPIPGLLLPMRVIFERLTSLVGHTFIDQGYDQERNQGMELHKMICNALGYDECSDDGQFPDLRNQLLEIKLQTSSTIDLGVIQPNSKDPLDMPIVGNRLIRPCDVRYALFSARMEDKTVILTHFYLTNGEAFFHHFPQFQGKVVNKKLQIRLPSDFFNS